jgi:hypothetical protein
MLMIIFIITNVLLQLVIFVVVVVAKDCAFLNNKKQFG